MQLSDVFLQLGEERLRQLVRGISIGKLRTYQLYERFKTRTHLPKVNTENLRKAAPRFWKRLEAHDDEFATDLSQAILIAHLDMIATVLNFLGIPNQEGFFEKDLDAKPYPDRRLAGARVRAVSRPSIPSRCCCSTSTISAGNWAARQQAFLPAA